MPRRKICLHLFLWRDDVMLFLYNFCWVLMSNVLEIWPNMCPHPGRLRGQASAASAICDSARGGQYEHRPLQGTESLGWLGSSGNGWKGVDIG